MTTDAKPADPFAFAPGFGMKVVEVEPGTVITDDATGDQVTITDEMAAALAGTIYCTPATYEALKAKCEPVSAEGVPDGD